MKKFLNILLKVLAAIAVLILVFVVIVVSSNSQKIPDIVVSNSSNATIDALRGNYSWNSFSGVLNKDDYSKNDFIYKSENTLLVSPNEKVSIYNNYNTGIRHNFEEIEFSYEDINGNAYNVQSTIDSDAYKNYTTIEFYTPQNEGTYLYFIKLGYFEKGEVEYSFKIIVSSEPTYNILELVKYKDSSIYDINKIKEIVSKLPFSNGIVNYIVRNNKSNGLYITYDELQASKTSYNNNAIALLALFPELDFVEFNSNTLNYRFSREELELIQGRSLLDYVDNPKLWELETFYKEKSNDKENTRYEAYLKIILDTLGLSSGDKVDNVAIDTVSFEKQDNSILDNTNSNKLINALKDYSKVIYDISLDEYTNLYANFGYIGADLYYTSGDSFIDNGLDGLEMSNSGDINTSGDIINSEEIPINIIYINGNNETHKSYYANYNDGSWSINLHN
ncbi:MAG: hypothetical protein IKI57_01340 [Clostridia bacterium]|nr:hypothetical protein [Clostridia bacterium]